MRESKCRSCGTPIIWAETEAGKRIPLEAKKVVGFVLFEDEDGKPPLACSESIHESHFAHCPQADEHRRSR